VQREGADEVDRLNEEIVEIRNTKTELQLEHNRKIADMTQELEDLKATYENDLSNVRFSSLFVVSLFLTTSVLISSVF
jgi:hypothetical protein